MSSNTKQYTITHKCEYEGEDFSFVVYLTQDEYRLVKDTIDKIKDTDIEDEFSIKETNLCDKDIDLINEFSTNTYMSRVGWYAVDFDELQVKKGNIPFYKGNSLYRVYSVTKMDTRKTYVTEIQAIDPETGELKVYAGPNVMGGSIDEAKGYCKENGLGYCKLLGVLHEINK